MYRINGLEEEVNYLKGQCTQGCCKGGAAGELTLEMGSCFIQNVHAIGFT